MHPVEQPGSAVRAMPCGLEPHQYDLHEHLFRGRHAGHIPLGRRMGALRLAGRRCSRSSAENSSAQELPGTVRRRIPAVHPDSVTTDRRRFRIPQPQAAPRPQSRTAFAAASGSVRLTPPLAPVSVRECRPASPQPKAKPDSGPVSRFTGRSRPLYPRRFRRTPRSDVAPEGPNYPKTASERYKQFYLSIN